MASRSLAELGRELAEREPSERRWLFRVGAHTQTMDGAPQRTTQLALFVVDCSDVSILARRAKTLSNSGSMTASPPRLLFVVNAAWFFISHRLPLAEAARRAGYEVHIASGAATADEVRSLEIAGFNYHSLGLKRASGNPFHNAALLLQLFKVYRAVRPAIVHHVTIKPVILGTLAARILHVPAVVNA